MSDYTPTKDRIVSWLMEGAYTGPGADHRAEAFDTWLAEHDAKVRAQAIREYVEAARENPHTQYWPASGVLDDAEQWADEIEKGTI